MKDFFQDFARKLFQQNETFSGALFVCSQPTMKLIFLLMAFVLPSKADHVRALRLLSRCQPETRFLDIHVVPPDNLDDIRMEERKEIMGDHQSGRFFTTARR